ncbi:MAG TPA: hypothetical protein VLW50_33330 [Streptosporangiaceae bacterium]|nr:hypothetical protein [Streptosporangiaceae bacterium]
MRDKLGMDRYGASLAMGAVLERGTLAHRPIVDALAERVGLACAPAGWSRWHSWSGYTRALTAAAAILLTSGQ